MRGLTHQSAELLDPSLQATKRIEDDGQCTSSEDSDSETLRKTTKQPPADLAIEEETGNTDARLEQDDLLSKFLRISLKQMMLDPT